MYLKKELRDSRFESIIWALYRGMVAAVQNKDRSEICYVLLRSATLAWIELGGGYNNGSDIKAILNDVADEFTAKVTHSLKGKKEKYGDVDAPIKVPDVNKSPIVDTKGDSLASKPSKDQDDEKAPDNSK